jgi:hypothetical protein
MTVETHDRNGRGSSPEHFVAYLTLAGIALYGFSRLALSLFYLPLRTTPEEVGLSYAITIVSIIGLLLTLAIGVAIISLFLTIVIPILYRVVIPIALTMIIGAVVVGAIIWLFVDFADGAILATAFFLLLFIILLTTGLTILSLLIPNLEQPFMRVTVPRARLIVCYIGSIALPITFLNLRATYYFGWLLVIIAWFSQKTDGGILAVLAQGDMTEHRIAQVLQYLEREASKSQLATANAKSESVESQVGVTTGFTSWNRIDGLVDDLLEESPESFAYHMRSTRDRLNRGTSTVATRAIKWLRSRIGALKRELKHMTMLLLRRYFLTFNIVLMAVVLGCLLLIPFSTYKLGKDVAEGHTYYALAPHGKNFWHAIVIPPFRAEPARLFWQAGGGSSNTTPMGSGNGNAVTSLANGQCVLYLGGANGTVVLYLNQGPGRGEAIRVPSDAVVLYFGDAMSKSCVPGIAPREWSIPVSDWVRDARAWFEAQWAGP